MQLRVKSVSGGRTRDTEGQPQRAERFGDFSNFISCALNCGGACNLPPRQFCASSSVGSAQYNRLRVHFSFTTPPHSHARAEHSKAASVALRDRSCPPSRLTANRCYTDRRKIRLHAAFRRSWAHDTRRHTLSRKKRLRALGVLDPIERSDDQTTVTNMTTAFAARPQS
jgi:hypothetical protein